MSLVELYAAMRHPDSGTVVAASARLETLIEDPATFPAAIEVLANPDPSVRTFAALLLQKMIKKHWQKVCLSEIGAQVKQGMLAALLREQDVRVIQTVVNAIEPICQLREVPWPELDECAMAAIQGDGVGQLCVGLLLFGNIVPYLDEGAIFEVLPMLCEKFDAAVESKNDIAIKAGCQLIATLATVFEPPLPDVLEACVVTMFRMLGSVEGITDSVLMLVKEDPVVPVGPLLEVLVGLLESAKDEKGAVQVILVIEKMVDVNFEMMVNYLEQLIPLLLKAGELLWTDVSCEDQNVWTVGNIIGSICRNVGADLYSVLVGYAQKASNDRELFVGVVVHDVYIEEAPEVVVKNLASFVAYLVQCCSPERHVVVREAALGALLKVVDVVNGGLIEYRQNILEALIPAIACEDESVVDKGLKTLESFLGVLPLEGKMTQPLMQALIAVVMHGDPSVRCQAVSTVSALIRAAEDEVCPWAPQLLQLFQETARQTDDTDLQISGIIGLARLHAQNFEANQASLPESISLFIQAARNGNTSVLGAVFCGFRTLMTTQVEMPPVMESLPVQIELALAMLKKELHAITIKLDEESKACDEEYNEDARAKAEALDLITAISKRYPESLAQILDDLVKLSVDMMSLPHVQLTIIKFFTQLVVTYDLDANLGISTLADMFEEDDPLVVGALFSAFGKLIEAHKNINDEMLTKLVAVASYGLSGKLACQADGELDVDLMRKLFKFFVILAIHAPQLFPLNKYIAVVKHYDPETETEFAGAGVMPFPYLCRPGVPNVDSIAQGEMIRLIMRGVSLCRGTISPDPIRSIQVLITDNFPGLNSLLPEVFANVNEILQMKFEGQPTLTETKVTCVSLLFSLLRKMPQEFDAATYLPLMMSISPDDSPKDSVLIYDSICFLMENASAVMLQFAPQITTTIARTFGHRAHAFASLKLPDELRAKLAHLLKQLMSQTPNASDALREVLDPPSLARLTSRLSE